MAGEAPPGYSSGGMVTKLAAARIAMARRLPHGDRQGPHGLHPLARDRGRRALHLVPARGRAAHRAQALDRRQRSSPIGALIVDDGAAAALQRGKSLLPAGVTAVEGEFERGDAVVVHDRRRPRDGARPVGLCRRGCPRASPGIKAVKSRPSSATVAATR